MTFTPKKSLTDSDIREGKSVDFIKNLLSGCGVKTTLMQGEKGANIDGYIELLDSEYRINGKITAQVKTVSPSEEGLFRFNCPTALLGYAERTTEIVLLMAVDHTNKTVLWKYISRELIDGNKSKADQDTIALHFTDDERLTSSNVEETINKWRDIVRQQLKLYNEAPVLVQENDKLRKRLIQTNGVEITLTKTELHKVQLFIDAYNSLMDRELLFVKQCLFPDVWKFGIAIFNYTATSLGYSIYSIHNGETAQLIKQVPSDFFSLIEANYDVISNYYVENPMENDYRQLVRERIKHHLDLFIKNNTDLPMTVPFAMERVAAYLDTDSTGWIVPLEVRDSFSHMMEWMSANVAKLLIPRTQVVYGHFHQVNMYDTYKSMEYLVSQGIETVNVPYPPKGKYGDTGMVYDWYNADGAYQKAKYVISAVNEAYQSYIAQKFPMLTKELDNFNGADLMAFDIKYGEHHELRIYYLKSNKWVSERAFLFAKNGDDAVISQIEKTNYGDRFETPYKYAGKDYFIFRIDSNWAYNVLYSNTPLKDAYQEILKKSFENLADKLLLNS